MTGARIWGLGWIAAGLATILVDPVAAWRSTVPYSFTKQAISDLGMTGCGPVDVYLGGPVEVCSPWWPLVDVTWVVAGLATSVAAVAVRRTLPLSSVAVALVVVAGLLLAGVGGVPADVNVGLHALLGVAGILLQNIALLVVARRLPGRPALAGAGLVGGVVGLVALLALFVPAVEPAFGLVERVAAYPFPAWLVMAGLVLARDRQDEVTT